MELRDLIVTPIVILLVYAVAYWIRPRVTDSINRKYFIPALTVRIIGALAVGFLYQFYYDGGDTFNFHTNGSRHIWEAFVNEPGTGFKLLFANGQFESGTFKYSSLIPFYQDPSSYFVVRIATIFDLFTFSSYAATAVLFSVFSFVGMWLLFLTFYKSHPHLQTWIATACFFVPSVFFWGSGLLKDTLTLGATGIVVYAVASIFLEKNYRLTNIILMLLGAYIIFVVKIYILLCLLPAILLWVFIYKLFLVRSVILKALIFPILIIGIILSSYWLILKISEGDGRYSIDKLADTAKITAYDIGFYTGRNAGSNYSLGELDGTFESMFRLLPEAINVALFRPYLWEIQNPLMMLSSLESFVLLLATLFLVSKNPLAFLKTFSNASILFCIVFSLTFAFAVGVSTFNFGTLVRYKIPMIPFYVIGLTLIWDQLKRDRKLGVFEVTE